MELKIFSGTSNRELVVDIINMLNKMSNLDYEIKNGSLFHHTFPSGEKYCQFKENIRGSDVFLVQSPSSEITNDLFMELLIMIDAAKRASADRITAVMPMSFYTRQDRKDKSRVPISSRLCFDLLEKSGVDRILTMDLHAEQIVGFTNLPIDHLMFNPILIDYIKNEFCEEHNIKTENEFKSNVFLMAPDAGALKRIEKYAHSLNCEFGFISKRRLNDECVELQSLIGNVGGKHVVIIDDLTESFGTLKQAAQACKEQGAVSVTTAVTHCCVTQTGIDRMNESLVEKIVDKIIFSDTISNELLKESNIYTDSRFVTLGTSGLFAEAIFNIHTNKSISGLF